MHRTITFVGVFSFFLFSKGCGERSWGPQKTDLCQRQRSCWVWRGGRNSARTGIFASALLTRPWEAMRTQRAAPARLPLAPPPPATCAPGLPPRPRGPALGTAQASCALGFQKGPELRRPPQGAAVEWGWRRKSPSE